MKKSTKKKTFWDMTDAERDADVKKYDKPLPASHFKTMSKADRAWFERVRSAGGPGVKRLVELDIDGETLDQVAAYCKKHRVTFTQAIRRGLKGLLAFAE